MSISTSSDLPVAAPLDGERSRARDAIGAVTKLDGTGDEAATTVESASTEQADALLALRVSELLERYPTMLQPLIEHGFGPLAQPALRAVLAPTVTLEQALRIRSLDEERSRDLMLCLVEIAGQAETGGGEWP